MKPSVGRTVHYVRNSSGGERYPQDHYAAMITEVAKPTSIMEAEETVGLFVFEPYGLKIKSLENGGVKHDENMSAGTWHWPERVAE